MNLSQSFNIFFWITFVFFNFKYFTNNIHYGFNIAYIAVLMIIMGFINQAIMNTNCNGTNSNTLFVATFFPWILIFTVMVALLQVYNGWKAPFSNTFGYFLALLSGYKSSLELYIKPTIKEQYNYVYRNPLIMINEYSIDKIDYLFTTESFTSVFDMENNRDEIIKIVTKLITFKELVSEFIWFLLTGFITISVSYNIIGSSNCYNSKTPEQQQSDHDEAISSQPTTDTGRVYTVTE